MRILYVEDNIVFAGFVIMELEDLGHTVIHGVGWMHNRPILMMKSSNPQSTFEVNVDQFDAAIIDHQLLGCFEGDEIIGYLTHIEGKPCVGCSSDRAFNRKATAKGAVHCVVKDSLLNELADIIERLSQPLPDDSRLVLE